MTENKSNKQIWLVIAGGVVLLVIVSQLSPRSDYDPHITSVTPITAKPAQRQCENNFGPKFITVCVGDKANLLDLGQSIGVHWHINRTVVSGVTSEQWVYGSSYLYVEDGIVTGIQVSH
jgi:hypothetical protein